MDRESLHQLLSDGLSLEQIGARVGKHPSTVSYWMTKYGLVAPGRSKYAAKGGIEKDLLEALVGEGKTIAEISDEVGLSKTAVRHWLRRHGLRTQNGRGPRTGRSFRAAKDSGLATVRMLCIHHGEADFVMEGRGYYRCKRCRVEAVAKRWRKLKLLLVEAAGGKCWICGYDRYVGALVFHHLDPNEKRLQISWNGVTQSLQALRAEASKCALLCSNCHAEVEAGLAAVPARVSESGAQSDVL